MLNSVNIIGRLTADPELKKTQSGLSVCSFTIANGRKLHDGKEETSFVEIETWNGTAEFVEKYFEKGKPICISGRIKTRSYEDKNGNKRKAWAVVATSVDFVPSEGKNGSRQDEAEEYIPDEGELPF